MASGMNAGKSAHRGTRTAPGRGRESHHSQGVRERDGQMPPAVPRPLQDKQGGGAECRRAAETMRGEGQRPGAPAGCAARAPRCAKAARGRSGRLRDHAMHRIVGRDQP